MKEINGRAIGASPIEQILGKRVFSSTYSTNSFDEYSASLKQMNLIDLHKHSMDVLGEMTRGDRTRVVMKLEAAFKRKNTHSDVSAVTPSVNLSQDKQDQVKQLLNRGI